MRDCIFCKIIAQEMPATLQYEDDKCVAFNDLYPKSRVHILVVPKKHIPTVHDIEDGEEKLMGHLIKVAKELAEKHSCVGYKLLFNVGKEGGQVIFHIHLHLLGN